MGKERRMNGELRFRLYFSRARARARRCVLQVFLFRFWFLCFWWWSVGGLVLRDGGGCFTAVVEDS